MRICERNNAADTTVSGVGGKRGAPGARAEFPPQPVVKTMVRQAVPLQPMEAHNGADLHLCPWMTPCRSGDCLKEAVTPWRACTGAGFWQDLWTCGERSLCWSRFAVRACDPVGDPCWNGLFLKDCSPWKGPTLEQFVKKCSLWEGPMLERFVENCLPWDGLMLEQGKRVRSLPPEEEAAAEIRCDELTATPVPCPPVLLGGRR